MFKQVRLNDAILKFYQRSQPIAFSNAETLYDDLVLLRDQILMYGDLSEAQTNYLNDFIEKFDVTLSNTVNSIFEKWLSDGFLVDLIGDIINEEVVKARDGEPNLNLRLNRDKQYFENRKLNRNENESIGMEMLKPDIKVAINEGTFEFSINASDIENGAISADKTNFMFNNVFNKSTATSNRMINSNGDLVEGSFIVSDRIQVREGATYLLSRAKVLQVIAQYDVNGNLVSFVSGYGTGGTDDVFEYKPTNPLVTHFRAQFSSYMDTLDTIMVIEGSLYPERYVPYGSKITNLNVDGENIEDQSISHKHLEKKSVDVDNTNYFVENLLNPETVYKDKMLNSSGEVVDGSFLVSDLIPVKAGEDYILTRARVAQVIAQYDKNGNFISFVFGYGTSGSNSPFEYKPRNPNLGFARVQFSKWLDNPYTFMFLKGLDYPSDYIPYGVGFEKQREVSPLKPLNVLVMGDSLSDANGKTPSYAGEFIVGFQKYLELAGCEVDTYAYGGATYRKAHPNETHPSLYTGYVTSDEISVEDYDVVILMGGTNDAKDEIHVGEKGSTDSSTTRGALSLIIEKIRSQNKDVKIVLFTPTQNQSSTHTFENDEIVYNALVDVANAYGVYSENLFYNGGVGKGNIEEFTYVDGVHWNNKLHRLIGQQMVGVLRKLAGR